MNHRVGVITFPGSLDDVDAKRAVEIAGAQSVSLWHADESLKDVDAVILPGGFSYGDYLRCGAISRFAPIMDKLIDAANGGLPVLGICNGFQILTESHLLPGALTRNNHLHFICDSSNISTAAIWVYTNVPGNYSILSFELIQNFFISNVTTFTIF